MNDVEILNTIIEMKRKCSSRQFGNPFANDPCDECPFYTIGARKNKKHCQLSALFGNLSSNPYVWNVNKINGILAEEMGLKEIENG